MLVKFKFSPSQINRYYDSALKDFDIADKSELPEVRFRFSYDCLIKLAITVCSHHGLRVKARQGHHVELIKQLSTFLNNQDILAMAEDMRSKRNYDLYGGGGIISSKETDMYLSFLKGVIKRVNKHIGRLM